MQKMDLEFLGTFLLFPESFFRSTSIRRGIRARQ